MKEKYLSTKHEPALSGDPGEPDPSEKRAAPIGETTDEQEAIRDSVTSEPALAHHADPQRWYRWLQTKRAQCTPAGDLGVTLLAAVCGGPFAVIGAMMAGQQGLTVVLYAVLFAPIIEELLKQSGMTFVLERKPYRAFAAWQFVFAGLFSGLIFATIENLMYIYVYLPGSGVADVEQVARFRWTVCTALHVGCSTIASLGLVRAWKRSLRLQRPPELADAVPVFAVAMAIHGTYNLLATLLESYLF